MGSFGSKIAMVAAALSVGGVTAAQAGPCTAQIAKTESQIRSIPVGSATGPSGTQTIGAQLHHQPTPGSVENAEVKAKADALAALDRARVADSAGDGAACNKALREAKDLYGLE